MSLAFDASEPTDGEMLASIRAGDPAAYGQLYERHRAAAARVARSLVSGAAEADDVVAEVFAATFAAIRRGAGPESEFLPYLLRSVRRECARSWRRRVRRPQAALTSEVAERTPGGADDEYARRDERAVFEHAFLGLPARMRTVLWYLEVDGLSHAEVARRTRSTPQAIAQLAVRSRRALGERYLQAHVAGTTPSSLPAECAAVRASLAEVVRDTASARRRHAVDEHVAACPECAAALDQLRIVNDRLRGLPLLALATSMAAPKPWLAGFGIRAGGWLAGPAVSLSAAAGLIVIATVTPLSLPSSSAPAAAAPAEAEALARPDAEAATLPTVATTTPAPARPVPVTAAPPAPASTTPPPPPPSATPATTIPAAVPAPTIPATTVPAPAPTAPPAPPAAPPTIGVTVDVAPVPLPTLPELPVVGQLDDHLDLPPVDVGVDLDGGVGAHVGVGEVGVDASIGADGVDLGVGGTLELPLLDAPPIELPPIELPPIGPLGG